MGVSSQAIAASTLPPSAQMPEPMPNEFEIIRQAVLVCRDRTLLDSLIQVPAIPEDILVAMHQLVDLIRKLRSPEQGWDTHTLTPEALVPYVTDETYDLLDLLQNSPLATSQQETIPSAPILLETLIPQLLWCIARSAYPTMQLIEGIPVQSTRTGNLWTPGILRLAVMLEIHTQEAEWCLDLVTGHPPQQLIDENFQVQSEEDVCLWHSPEKGFMEHEPTSQMMNWLDYQLQGLTESLLSTTPILKSWLSGLPIELLVPGETWQSSELRLKLGFEFTPYEPDELPLANLSALPNPIEAEFIDETTEAAATYESAHLSSSPNIPLMPIAVVEMPLPALIATTIVRLADPATLETFAQLATQQELAKSINIVRLLEPSHTPDESVRQAVRQAYQISELTYQAVSSSFSLLQPELLIDELLPKLLWHITRCSYLEMQWISGVPATVLQPDAAWETGILRLKFVLELKTAEEQWCVDLAAGHFNPSETSKLASTAIARIDFSPVFSEPLLAEQLQLQLLRSIRTAAPEIAQLMEGVEVQWLSKSHDWHPGTLKLHANLEFVPNIFG